MLLPVYQRQFKRDVERTKLRGNNMNKLKKIIGLLITEEQLPVQNRNHKLKGTFIDYWECHIEPDWLLIYKKTSTDIIFVRTGTHADLF